MYPRLLALLAGLICLIGCGGNNNSSSSTEDPSDTPGTAAVQRAGEIYEVYEGVVRRQGDPPIISLAQFERLPAGIIYEEAVRIIGAPADVIVDDSVGSTGASRRTAKWINSDGSSATLVFLNMRLGPKQHDGLR